MEYEDEDFAEDDDAEAAVEGVAEVVCPYCGESQEIVLDAGGGPDQEYVQDCEVCCRPWNVHVAFRHGGTVRVSVERADDEEGGIDKEE